LRSPRESRRHPTVNERTIVNSDHLPANADCSLFQAFSRSKRGEAEEDPLRVPIPATDVSPSAEILGAVEGESMKSRDEHLEIPFG
jgi:hypothetical protein